MHIREYNSLYGDTPSENDAIEATSVVPYSRYDFPIIDNKSWKNDISNFDNERVKVDIIRNP